ncbi:MAG: hypothetical protein ACE5IM_13780 [Nitrospinota bacterium]
MRKILVPAGLLAGMTLAVYLVAAGASRPGVETASPKGPAANPCAVQRVRPPANPCAPPVNPCAVPRTAS